MYLTSARLARDRGWWRGLSCRGLLSVCLGSLFWIGSPPAAGGERGVSAGDSPAPSALDCSASSDARAALAALVGAGGTLTGKRLDLPSGCKLLLGGPEPGAFAVEVAPGTTIECADTAAGFVAARRWCVGGDTPGAACRRSEDCQGTARCAVEGNAATEFAPDEDASYGMVALGEGASLRRCSLWTNQGVTNSSTSIQPHWGLCDGHPELAGRVCRTVCDGSSGLLTGIACRADADCGTGACANLADCDPSRGAVCSGQKPTRSLGQASGPGVITALRVGPGALAEEIRVWDSRKGDPVVDVEGGTVIALDTTALTPTTCVVASAAMQASHGCPKPFGLGRWQRIGVRLAQGSLSRSRVQGWRSGVELVAGFARVTDSEITTQGTPTDPGWIGAAGVRASRGGQYIVAGNFFEGAFTCFDALEAQNAQFHGNRCTFGDGPKVQICSAGHQIQNNYLAWSSNGRVLSFGNSLGRCAGGPKAAAVCVAGAAPDSPVGCPASDCLAHEDFVYCRLINHVMVQGNLLHSNRHGKDGALALVGTQPTRACQNGRRPGRACRSDADCGPEGLCAYLRIQNSEISGNLLHALGAGSVGLDLDEPSIGKQCIALEVTDTSCPRVGDRSACAVGVCRPSVIGNRFENLITIQSGKGAVGVALPDDGESMRENRLGIFLAAPGALGTQASLPVRGWRSSFGHLHLDAGAVVTTEEILEITLDAATAIAPYQVVAVAASVPRAVRVAEPAERAVVGCALAAAAPGESVRIATAGKATCRVSEASAGDRLRIGSEPGSFVAASSAEDAVAIALEEDLGGAGARWVVLQPSLGRPGPEPVVPGGSRAVGEPSPSPEPGR